jgi:hypothetical protein
MADTAEYPIATTEGFPHGLMCPACQRTIKPGQPYALVPTGVNGDVFTLRIHCVYCTGEGS